MLYRTKHKGTGKTLYTSRPLLITAAQGYSRPGPGKEWFATTTTVWRVDELIRRRVRDWRRLTGETGHSGARDETFRGDHESVYTGTHSVFPAPLVEWILLRYGGPPGGRVLDAFAGGPPRALVAALMGFEYHGFEIRKEQIEENEAILKCLKLKASYHLGDGRFMDGIDGADCGLTCPPYHDLEVYSNRPDDLSALGSYAEFNASMLVCAHSYYQRLKPGAFMCIVVGLFRDKSGELVDFRAHTVENFREVGFFFHQEIILSKNFGSAAKRSTNAWKGLKLVPIHEYLLIFRKPTAQ
jgi:DNA modification methylase